VQPSQSWGVVVAAVARLHQANSLRSFLVTECLAAELERQKDLQAVPAREPDPTGIWRPGIRRRLSDNSNRRHSGGPA
jgi:hypothetical protein